MCGIVGGISFTGDFFPHKTDLRQASSFLKYRGPDDRGELLLNTSQAQIAFSHTRLSVIDLSSTGHQPMASRSGKTIIVYNGEIYNYQLLKTELIQNGYSFDTKSDTEVILNGFECWGIEKTLFKLDGMFAFALFDKTRDALFLARDRFGKKPLYYFVGNKKLAFSSDIRSFGRIENISLTIDLHALGYFFAELATPHEATIWKEIKKVRPANFIKFDRAGVSDYKPYWQLQYTEDCDLSREDIAAKTEFLLGEAVKKRLVADVNVSALLSGGIDSSLVVAKMAEQSSARIKTYTVGFKENQFNELPFARQVVDIFNTDHKELLVDCRSIKNIDDLILEFGEPFADSSMIPTYLMSMEISAGEKVALGGDGGDELFGGYHSYYFAHKFDAVKKFGFALPVVNALCKIYPSYRTEFLRQLLLQTKRPRYSLLDRRIGFGEDELNKLFFDQVFGAALQKEHQSIWEAHSPHSLNELINVLSASLKTRLLNDYLVKVDRASMFASLEIRSPFLDRELAEFAATLKPNQLFREAGTKSILKYVAEKYFNKEFVHRHKMGFALPLGEWFRGEMAHDLKEVVLKRRQGMIDFNYQFIEKLLQEHFNGKADHSHKLWALYVFHVWANNQ